MRTLGYSTSLLLTASLAVAPACKKDESTGDTAAKQDGEKADDKKATDGAAVEAKARETGGLGATATKLAAGSGSSGVGLIPDQAEFIMGFSVGSIMSSPVYKLAENEINSDPEVQKLLTMVKDCGLDPHKLENVVVGISKDESFALVMVGEGLGDDEKAKCLLDGVQTSAGEGPVGEVVSEGGKKSIQFSKGRAYLVDGRTLAMVSTAWDGAVVGLIDGTGSPALSNSKKDLFAKVDTRAAMWGVATIPAELAGLAPMLGAPAEFAMVKSVTGSVDLSDGVGVSVLAGFDSEATAKSVSTQLQGMLADISKDAPAELGGVVKSLKIEALGSDVKVAMSATADDVTKIQAAAPI